MPVGLVAVAAVWTAALTAGGTAGPTGAATTNRGPAVTAPVPGHRGATSYDWAGYVDSGHAFTTVTGTWRVPAVSCPVDKLQQSADWVGLDGFVSTDATVEQAGTDSDCDKATRKASGGPTYYAWYELYPASDVVLPSASYPVSPGDSVTATVAVAASDFVLTLTDAGRWTHSVTVAPPSTVRPLDASAEWIVEAPTLCHGNGSCKDLPLPDFGTVTFTGATADGLSVTTAASAATPLTMVTRKGAVRATTSALTADGSSFAVTWASS